MGSVTNSVEPTPWNQHQLYLQELRDRLLKWVIEPLTGRGHLLPFRPVVRFPTLIINARLRDLQDLRDQDLTAFCVVPYIYENKRVSIKNRRVLGAKSLFGLNKESYGDGAGFARHNSKSIIHVRTIISMENLIVEPKQASESEDTLLNSTPTYLRI